MITHEFKLCNYDPCLIPLVQVLASRGAHHGFVNMCMSMLYMCMPVYAMPCKRFKYRPIDYIFVLNY